MASRNQIPPFPRCAQRRRERGEKILAKLCDSVRLRGIRACGYGPSAPVRGSSLFSVQCRPQLGLFSSAISATLREPGSQTGNDSRAEAAESAEHAKGACGTGEPADMAIPPKTARNPFRGYSFDSMCSPMSRTCPRARCVRPPPRFRSWRAAPGYGMNTIRATGED